MGSKVAKCKCEAPVSSHPVSMLPACGQRSCGWFYMGMCVCLYMCA